jgi:hypothetical protein
VEFKKACSLRFRTWEQAFLLFNLHLQVGQYQEGLHLQVDLPVFQVSLVSLVSPVYQAFQLSVDLLVLLVFLLVDL